MSVRTPLETVRAMLAAYVNGDRAAIEALVDEDFSFTSPMDNGLDRESYFAICWPSNERIVAMDLLHSAEQGEHVWIVYEGTAGDRRFRNAELHRVRDGRVVSVEVYFGWNVPHPVPPGTHDVNASS